MRCEANSLQALDPFRGIRRDFERQLGLRGDTSCLSLSVIEKASEATIEIDVPGFNEESLNVTVQDGQLFIEGERREPSYEGGNAVFCNRSFGKFRRVLNLHDSIDPGSVDAVLQDGVLSVTLRKRPEVQPRKISIRQPS